MKELEPESCALPTLAVRVPAAGTFPGCDFGIEMFVCPYRACWDGLAPKTLIPKGAALRDCSGEDH
jgi:hypothetical protein